MVTLEQKFHTMTIIVVIKNVKVMATSIGAKCKTENDGNNCKKKKKGNYNCNVVDKNPKS
jgi:hypothetical protein